MKTRGNQYTDKDCIKALRDASKQLGKSPSQPEYQSLGIRPTAQTISVRIGDGSWTQAKQVAGLSPTPSNHLPVNEDYFQNMNAESVYWMGFLLGDGYVTERVLSIGLQRSDVNHLQKFKEDVESEHKIGEYSSDTESAQICITNERLVEPLIERGIGPNKTYGDSVPEVPRNLFPHFFRGWIDADGHYGIHGRKIQLTAANPKRLERATYHLPVESRVRDIPDTNYANLYITGRNRVERVVKWLYPDGPATEPALTRKKASSRGM